MLKYREILLRARERAFAIPQYSSFVEFLEAGFSLNKEDRMGTFRLEYTPWLKTVAEWVDSPEVEWIHLIQGSQTCKTTLQMAFLLYVAQKGYCRVEWVQSTEEEVKQFIADRLRPYIDNYDSEAITKRTWRVEAFKVFKARVKVGYASNEQTMKQVPAQYVIGDECAMWKYPISLLKKRTRTYTGVRKGIFATTPPKNGTHFSWQEAQEADFYQWWVPCPQCGEFQPLVLANLKWEGKTGNTWSSEVVEQTAHYECSKCKKKLYERDKLDLIKKGKAVCVDPRNGYKPCEPAGNCSKTIQVSALYSIFTPWGKFACEFLKAKHSGADEFKIFITDELAEVPENVETQESLKNLDIAKFIDAPRKGGFLSGYDLYTAGIDVQRNGELYVVIDGWKKGIIPTGHVLLAEVVAWKAGNFQQKWFDLLTFLAPFASSLSRVALDATDGLVTQDIYDFCNYAGRQFIALKDSTTLHIKTCVKQITPEVNGHKVNKPQLVLLANSDKIKDDLMASFQRPPGEVGAWSFPSDISQDFLKAMGMEHRDTDPKTGKSSWKTVYVHAPNHFFSALVYSCAAMEEFRVFLQGSSVAMQVKPRPRVISSGAQLW